ncbi:adenylate cyclase [Selenihalanaerobacter shriftii]|uniref:Adenylate cyclase n=2 Tax=Selenihalanaerobacter shriftii TaxID=142842 RepID=A0A1T4KQZ0_9FIRM|nr:adenylate cyclase [Selenihalanaerobacter shriftii]
MIMQLKGRKLWIKVGVTVSFLIITFFYIGFFSNLELITLDYRFIAKHLFSEQFEKQESDITLVAVDQMSLSNLGNWPFSRKLHAKVIRNLTDAGAKVIGVDFIFNEENVENNSADKELIQATKEARKIIYPAVLDLEIERSWLRFKEDNIEIKGVKLPFKKLGREATDLGYINLIIDRDGLVRKLPTVNKSKKDYLPLSYQIITEYDDIEDNNLTKTGLINYVGPSQSFPKLSYYEVLNNDFSKELVEDKIILIGAMAPALGDKYLTPYSIFGPMYGVEIHANIIQTLLDKNTINKLNFTLISLIVLIIGLINSYFFVYRRPKIGVIILLIEFIFFILLSLYLFIQYALWLKVMPILFNIVMIYLVALGYHYFFADQKQMQLKESFAHYLPEELVNEILKNPEQIKLGGQRQQVTILFADIRGFTAYTEDHTPEEVVNKVNQYLSVMTRNILIYDGMLDKYIGDGIMAVFGAPLTDEKHLEKAIEAALEIREITQNIDDDLAVGIGISQGEVVAGNIGSKERMDYTVIGDAVNLAARLEEIARSEEILITTKDYKLLESKFTAESSRKVELKGKEGEFEIYNLKSMRG